MAINPDKIVVMDQAFYTPRTDIYDKDTNGPVLQLGVTLTKFTGDLYMKLSHFDYIARQKLNYLSPTEADEMSRKISNLEAENESLKELLKEKEDEAQNDFNGRLEHFLSNFGDSRTARHITPPVANDSEPAKPATGKANSKSKAAKISDDDF